MKLRDSACPNCRQLTSGDCGEHGAIVVGAAEEDFDAVAKQACKEALIVGRTLLNHHMPLGHDQACRCDYHEFGRLLDRALRLGWGIR